jgi:lysozyme
MDQERLLARLKEEEGDHEGMNLCPTCGCSRDPLGIATIGYGWNIRDVPIPPSVKHALLQRSIERAIQDARALFPSFDTLSPVRQEVLSELSFNLGRSRLALFLKTRAAVDAGDWDEAAVQILDSKAARQLPLRYGELADMMSTG